DDECVLDGVCHHMLADPQAPQYTPRHGCYALEVFVPEFHGSLPDGCGPFGLHRGQQKIGSCGRRIHEFTSDQWPGALSEEHKNRLSRTVWGRPRILAPAPLRANPRIHGEALYCAQCPERAHIQRDLFEPNVSADGTPKTQSCTVLATEQGD